ncbi:MAG: hypothetical protein QM774_09110 [Gordonia sp. (in: high G+C Gram-positive bacteria)]|uniref:hypothetical protein n=1 Tax=Gordonia sp. (in: high G+C Gram-positive bacteria) TaxID=84139 RepID=UPI0039E3721E
MSLSKGVPVLLAAILLATVVLGVRYWSAQSVESARNSALAAARDYAKRMYEWTPDTIEGNTKYMMGVLTGQAKKDYEERVVGERIVEQAKAQKVVSTITDQGSAVEENTRNTARVLLFVNQSASSAAQQDVEVNPSRMTFTMERDGGTWKISQIEMLTDQTLQDAIDPNGDRATATPVPGPSSPVPSSAAPSSAPSGG